MSTPKYGKRRTRLTSLHITLCIALLFFNYFLAQYDKYVLSYFQADLRRSLGLSASQYGVLSGYALGLSYASTAIPVAILVDSIPSARVWVLAVASAWWSLSIVFQSLSHTFWQILLARLSMGLAQSCAEPISVSLISDLCGGWQKTFIGSSVLYAGVYLGEAASGQIATFYTANGDWRYALRASGYAGIITAALIVIIVRERERIPGVVTAVSTSHDSVAAPGLLHSSKGPLPKLTATFKYILQLRSWWLLLVAASVRQMGANVFGFYMPGYLSSIYPSSPQLLSHYGIIVGVVGTVAVITGGVITSLLWNRTQVIPVWLAGIGGVVSAISVIFMVLSRDVAGGSQNTGLQALYAAMTFAYISGEIWFGAMNALVASLLPAEYKTIGLSIWATLHILIYSSGPEIIGLALEGLDPESGEYQHTTKIVLASVIAGSYVLGSIVFFIALPRLKLDISHGVILSDRLSRRTKIVVGLAGFALFAIVVGLFVASIVDAAS